MHGHGGWINYFKDKLVYFRDGYQLDRYIPKLFNAAPGARVYIFGHTHFPENLWREGKLVFNPGSASSSITRKLVPTVGILRFYSGGNVESEIIRMFGLRITHHQWVEDNAAIFGT
jgi:predicted phosphodiesterase